MGSEIVWLADVETASDIWLDEPAWGKNWVPRLIETLGIDDPKGRITGVQLRFQTGDYMHVMLFEGDKVIAIVSSGVRDIMAIKKALNLPEIAHVLTITAKKGEFVQFEYKFAFEKDTLDKVLDVLAKETIR